MAVLVTGGTGFVGLNVCEALLERGEEVVALGRGALPGDVTAAFARYTGRFHVVDADVRDGVGLGALFHRHRIDRVVHAAVITAGPERERHAPREIVDVNLAGTVAVLDAARVARVGRIVYLSSGSVYGGAHDTEAALDEDTACRPASMYAITKFAAERTSLRLAELWGLDLRCARLGSVIGPWERDTGVRDTLSMHLQIREKAARGEPVVLPAREQRRDNVYSRDVAAGVLALLDAGDTADRVFCLTSGFDWRGTMPRWCEALRGVYPAFSHRVAGAQETPTVAYVETRDRAPMRIDRILAQTRYRPAYPPAAAFADYVEWIRQTQSTVAPPA
jgi:nucleoside-diphosphate-sugar epimerase